MRAWKTFKAEGKLADLELLLNKDIEKNGFTVFSIFPRSFGYDVVAFIDKQ